MIRLNLIFILTFLLQSTIFAQTYDNTNYDLKYECLRWEVNPEYYYINGSVLSSFVVLNDAYQIVFELANELTVDSVIFQNKKNVFLQTDNHLIIIFQNNLIANNLYNLTVFYHGVPPHETSRAFVVNQHNFTPLMWTLSEPMGAKDWFPCKQTLNDKIDSIDIYVTTPQQYKVASNGILMSENITGNLKTTHWKHNHLISNYLIGIAITDYAVYSDYVKLTNFDSLQILNYVYPEDLDYAKENTPNIFDVMQYFDKTFLPYPFEKYGHAQFNFGGGMEHQTMSFMANFEHSLMAHELAHQWFGDYITCGSWHDIWLNESFATYLDGLTTEQKLTETTWTDWKHYQIADITSNTNGSVYVQDTTNQYSIFNHRLVYAKGAMVLNTLRNQIGDSLFFLSIKNYLNDPKLAYNYALTTDLKSHFEKTTKLDLTNFFNDWIYGEGYPIYNILWTQTDDNKTKIIVNQTQSDNSVDCFELKIPILFKGRNKDTLLILNNLYNYQEFEADINFNIKSAIFDPEYNIITKGSQISRFYTSLQDFTFQIVPNPANNTIDIEFPIDVKINKITILDNIGKIVLKQKINFVGQTYNLKISDLKTGTYIIYIETSKQKLSKKFVVLNN